MGETFLHHDVNLFPGQAGGRGGDNWPDQAGKGACGALQRAQTVVMSPPELFWSPSLPKASHGLAVPSWGEDGGGLCVGIALLGRTSVSRTCLALCGGREGSERVCKENWC